MRARAYYTSNRLIISTNNLPGPLTPQIITKGTETWIIRKFKYLFCFCRFSCFWLLCSMLCVCEHCFYFEPLLSLLLPTLSGMIHIHLEIKYIWLQSLTMRLFFAFLVWHNQNFVAQHWTLASGRKYFIFVFWQNRCWIFSIFLQIVLLFFSICFLCVRLSVRRREIPTYR